MHLPEANNNKYSKFNTSKSISYQIQKTMMWNHCQKGKINKYVQIFSFFQLKPDGWKENRQFLAKSCIHLKDYSAALHWLDQANELPVKNPDVSFSCQKMPPQKRTFEHFGHKLVPFHGFRNLWTNSFQFMYKSVDRQRSDISTKLNLPWDLKRGIWIFWNTWKKMANFWPNHAFISKIFWQLWIGWIHSVLMSVELIAFGHVLWNLSKFLYAKNHFLASKGKETPHTACTDF